MTSALRVAVLSDVHGNLPALHAVLASIDECGPFERVIAAGDHCLNGPDPAESFDTLLQHCTSLLIGNADRDIVLHGHFDPGLGQKKRASIEWTRGMLGAARISQLERLPFDDRVVAPDGSSLLVVHANPYDLDRHIFPDMSDEALLDLVGEVDAAVLAFGHLHIPFTRRLGSLTLENIAAAGLPRDGDRRAAWAEIAWTAEAGWQSSLHRVDYDHGATVLRILDSGMPHAPRRIRDLLRATYD